MSAANKSSIVIAGALFVQLQGTSKDGRKISCSTMVYISPSAEGFFLSLEAMLDLGLITPDSDFYPPTLREKDIVQQNARNCSMNLDDDKYSVGACSCPLRSQVPHRPASTFCTNSSK